MSDLRRGRAALAAYFSNEAEALAADGASYVADRTPELRSNPALMSLLIESFGAHVRLFVDLLSGTPISPDVPMMGRAFSRGLAREGSSLEDSLRMVRVGYEWGTIRVCEFLEHEQLEDNSGIDVLRHASRLVFEMTDGLSAQICEEYAAEAAAALRGVGARRREVVEALRRGDVVDVAEASLVLDYGLVGRHVAVLCWGDVYAPAADQECEGAVTALAEVLGSGHPLVVAEGPAVVGGWIPVAGEGELDGGVLARAIGLVSGGLRVAVGEPGVGVAGFRRSRQQAERVRSVMLAGGGDGFVAYRDVALISLLLADADAARAFVREELGGLASGEDAEELRPTLAQWLASGGDEQQVAERLGVEIDEVQRRLERIERALGYPPNQRRTEIAAALRVVEIEREREAAGGIPST